MSEEINDQMNEQEETSVEATEESNDDFVSREEFNTVFKENMKRKAKLKQLESELRELRSKTGEVEKVSEDVEKYRKLLEEKDRAITELRHKTKLRDKLSVLDVVNDRVSDLVFDDAMNADVLDDDAELERFLKMWKKDNPSFFKAESTIATSPQQKQKVETQPVEASSIDAFRAMSKEERLKLPKTTFDKFMSELRNQAS